MHCMHIFFKIQNPQRIKENSAELPDPDQLASDDMTIYVEGDVKHQTKQTKRKTFFLIVWKSEASYSEQNIINQNLLSKTSEI